MWGYRPLRFVHLLSQLVWYGAHVMPGGKMGVTGTRRGASARQLRELRRRLRNTGELHHGDCVGVDEQAHNLAVEVGVPAIFIHPPRDPKYRAWCGGGPPSFASAVVARPGLYICWLEPKEYLERNRDIVDATDELVVVPGEATEQRRSGTWSTKRYAERGGRPFVVLEP